MSIIDRNSLHILIEVIAKSDLAGHDIIELQNTNNTSLEPLISGFYTPVFKTRRIMVYQCPTVRFTCRTLT